MEVRPDSTTTPRFHWGEKASVEKWSVPVVRDFSPG